MTTYADMVSAIEAHNAEAIAEVAHEHSLTSHVRAVGAEFECIGPIWLAQATGGVVRIRVLFTGRRGVQYTDAGLIAESVFPNDRDVQSALTDELCGGPTPVHETTIVSLTRGLHNALLVPIDALITTFDLGALSRFPSTNWARSWASWPFVSDGDGGELIANGVPVA